MVPHLKNNINFIALIIVIYNINITVADIEENISDEDLVNESLAKCLLGVFDNHLKESENIATLLESDSDKNIDRILLRSIHQQSKWPILGLHHGELFTSFENVPVINNYLIQIRGVMEIKKDLEFLKRKSWNSHAKFIIIANKFFEDSEHIQDHIFNKLWNQTALNAIVILPKQKNSTSFEIHTWFPYENGNCGNYLSSSLIDECDNGYFKNGIDLFPRKIPSNLNGCPVIIRTIIWPPFVMEPNSYNRTENGLNFTIGLEIVMMNTIAKAANFKIIYTMSEKPEDYGFILDNGSSAGIFKVLMNGEADIGMSSLAATTTRYMYFDASVTYSAESLTWCVPSATLKPEWLNVFNIYNKQTWFLIYFGFMILLIFTWLVAVAIDESIAYTNMGNCFINMYAILSGLSVVTRPTKWLLRAIFILCAFYNFILASVYQTSLISFLTQPAYETQITNVEQIFDRNIHFLYLSALKFYFTSDSNDWKMQKIVSEMSVCEDVYDCINIIAQKRTVAMATPRLFLLYVSGKFINRDGHLLLNWFKEDMVSYPVQMFMRKGFPLQHLVNSYIVQILQSGIQDKWQKDLQHIMKERESAINDDEHDESPQYLTVSQLQGAFFVLFIGLFISIFAFIFELSYYKAKKRFNERKSK